MRADFRIILVLECVCRVVVREQIGLIIHRAAVESIRTVCVLILAVFTAGFLEVVVIVPGGVAFSE
ncbi:hypothetical protein HMPREF2946_04505 [Actinomyces sp. HMSC062G12]|nr:hypothetical protein HMPREF2946_04505 [Actinomyces sp. HMSC062G12]